MSDDNRDFQPTEQRPQMESDKLIIVLSKMFRKTISRADYEFTLLHGGTLGNVRLVTGMAETTEGEYLSYKIVWKTQQQWERYDDPGSWRREYDLYASDFKMLFSESFRYPECYHAEINDGEMQLWMEYIDGVSGGSLTSEMLERAAEELGRFQGKLYAEQPSLLLSLTNLSKAQFTKNTYLRYRSWPVLYDFIRSRDCDMPKDLSQMLIDFDNDADEIFSRIDKLPIVLCHRDCWVANLFYSDGAIVLIDWDTAGWGHMGEDIASLIADEANISHMVEYYQRCVPAYYRGFSEYSDMQQVSDHCIHELMLAMFGYRLVEWYLFAEEPEAKSKHLAALQKIYEMRHMKF